MRQLRWLPLTFAVAGSAACGDVMAPGDAGNLVPRTVQEDRSLPAIEMNGSRFHLETFGNPANPVVVFLHGGPGGDYRGLLKMSSLADEYFLVYWDQRGAGLSQRHDKDVLTRAVYINDLNTLIDRYSPTRPVLLIGESWGGMFATDYINKYPKRVAGAVLIEPGPLDGATAERLEDDMFDLDISAEWLNDWAWNSQFFSPNDHARMDYQRMLGKVEAQPKFHESKDNPASAWREGAAAARYLMEDVQENGVFKYDFTTNLSAFTTPVLFITGGLSEVVGESLQRTQMRRYPSASLKVIEGVGHDVYWIKATEVLTHIRPYLAARKGAIQ